MVLLFEGIYGSKVVIIEEDIVYVEGRVGVRETGTRSGRSKGVDRWAVRGVFLSKAGKLRG